MSGAKLSRWKCILDGEDVGVFGGDQTSVGMLEEFGPERPDRPISEGIQVQQQEQPWQDFHPIVDKDLHG